MIYCIIIIKDSNIYNDPYYDFAFINNDWYLINDVEMFGDNLDEIKESIIIIKSIDKEIIYFFEKKHNEKSIIFLITRSINNPPFLVPFLSFLDVPLQFYKIMLPYLIPNNI